MARRLSLPALRTCAVLLGLASLAACDRGGAPPPEVLRSQWAAVHESDIHAAIVGDDIELLVPIERVSTTDVSGRLQATIYDVAGRDFVQLGGGALDFDLASDLETYRIVVRGAGADLERVDTATLVIGWSVETDGTRLYGKRSLYDSLGRLDVWLHGPSELAPGASSPLRVAVREPNTGAPVVSADVLAELLFDVEGESQSRELFHGSTDANGDLLESISMPADVDAGRIRVTVTEGEVQVWTTHSVTTRVDNQLYLSSDKTLYKPGQDVRLRLLAVSGPDRLPVAAREVSFEARDGEGNKVFRRSARTDAFGVAAIVVPTDVRVNEGAWTFRADIDGRSTELELPVERYTLPVMTVNLALDRDFALPGETVTGHLTATYVFGEPVANASLSLEAATAGGVYVSSLFGTTDAEGRYDFDLTIPDGFDREQLEDHGDNLRVNVQVTDTASQVERGQVLLPLAAAPLILNLIAEPGAVVPGAASEAFVTVSDPLGRPVVAQLEATAFDVPISTDASGVARVHFTGPATDTDALRITATDGAGRTHFRDFNLAGSDASELRVRFDRSVYKAGDEAQLRVFSPAAGRGAVPCDRV